MAGERTKLVVAQRERLGSAESRRMRKEGLVPGVLYGSGEPVAAPGQLLGEVEHLAALFINLLLNNKVMTRNHGARDGKQRQNNNAAGN